MTADHDPRSALQKLLDADPVDRIEQPPLDCPVCRGHGGNPVDGSCEHCDGSGIDPSHPASPL